MPTLASRKTAQRRQIPRISVHELGRPKARLGNPNTGIPEVIVQPLYDIYAVLAGNAMGKLTLFTVPQGQTYNFNGITAFSKGPGHTNLVQAGMLESSYTFVVRALAVTVMGNQASTTNTMLNPVDANNFLSSFFQFTINRKSYYDGIGFWLPCGGGTFWSGVGTLSAPAATGTATNGLPQSKNTYAIPGGQFINPQETFAFTIDPTQNSSAPSALAAVLPAAGVPASGIFAWVRLDGTLNRVAQ
jgi:hypothetical protein